MRRPFSVGLCMILFAGMPGAAGAERLAAAPPAATMPAAGEEAQAPQGRASGTQPDQAPPPPPRPRRRGSMVGYIDDPIIESKLRVHVETAYENTVPDRAEFFCAKCGCYATLDPTDPARDPAAPGPQPGAANNIAFQQLVISAELALNDRVSAFGQLPVRWLQPKSFLNNEPGFSNQAGLGDLRAGLRLGLVASDVQRVTAQVRFYLPSGDASKGLGTDHGSAEPALLFYRQLSDVVRLESQVGLWVPFGGSSPVPTQADGRFAGHVLLYGIGPSFALYTSDRVQFAPVVELVGWHVLDGHQTAAIPDAGGINIVNLKLGARTTFAEGSLYVGYGFALTDSSWYDDILRVEYRYTF